MAKDDATHDETERPATDHPPRGRSSNGSLIYDPVGVAAPKVGISEEALRARCRRAGIRAMKFGRTWRIRFPKDGQS